MINAALIMTTTTVIRKIKMPAATPKNKVKFKLLARKQMRRKYISIVINIDRY